MRRTITIPLKPNTQYSQIKVHRFSIGMQHADDITPYTILDTGEGSSEEVSSEEEGS
jgi:hypothetical protein